MTLHWWADSCPILRANWIIQDITLFLNLMCFKLSSNFADTSCYQSSIKQGLHYLDRYLLKQGPLLHFRLFLFILTDNHRHSGVVKNIITDTPYNCSSYESHPPATTDYHPRLLLLCCLHYGETWVTVKLLHCVGDLTMKKGQRLSYVNFSSMTF